MALESLPKSERLCGLSAVGALFEHGKGTGSGCLRCRYLLQAPALPDAPESAPGPSRIVVSVPKRLFKRAVKRNLLKRRIREAYRRQKELLGPGYDVLFIYAAREVLPYETIYAHMTAVLVAISGRKMGLADNQKDA